MTTEYRGQADVARWCGVTAAAVSNWIRRFPGETPEPGAKIVNETSELLVVRGWLPELRPEWEAFAAARRASGGRGTASTAARRNRDAAALIAQGAEDGTIDPAEAVRLLAKLI